MLNVDLLVSSGLPIIVNELFDENDFEKQLLISFGDIEYCFQLRKAHQAAYRDKWNPEQLEPETEEGERPFVEIRRFDKKKLIANIDNCWERFPEGSAEATPCYIVAEDSFGNKLLTEVEGEDRNCRALFSLPQEAEGWRCLAHLESGGEIIEEDLLNRSELDELFYQQTKDLDPEGMEAFIEFLQNHHQDFKVISYLEWELELGSELALFVSKQATRQEVEEILEAFEDHIYKNS